MSDATKILCPPKGNKITKHQMQTACLILLILGSRPGISMLTVALVAVLVDIFQHLPTWKVDFHFDRHEIFLIFQWLKSHWNR